MIINLLSLLAIIIEICLLQSSVKFYVMVQRAKPDGLRIIHRDTAKAFIVQSNLKR